MKIIILLIQEDYKDYKDYKDCYLIITFFES
jgi:hypothetical protein